MSIEVFDLEGIKNGARGYSSVVSDGNYLYFIPLNNEVNSTPKCNSTCR